MVCTVDHARQVIAKAEETGKVVMISYQRHLQGRSNRYVRNQIAAGELGDIQFISALQDQKWYQGTIGLWAAANGAVGRRAAQRFGKPPTGHRAVDDRAWRWQRCRPTWSIFDSEVDINSALSLRFRNGALGTIAVVGNSPTGGMWEDITIWGTKGRGPISARGQIFLQNAAQQRGVRSKINLPGSTTPDQNFIDAILGRDQVQVPPECGLRVIELTEAAWASAASGQPVKIKSI